MATKTKSPTKAQIMKIWQEAKPIKGRDPKLWRKDENGTVMKFSELNSTGNYAWEIK